MPRREIDTSWDELGYVDVPAGIRVSRFHIGDPDSDSSVAVFKLVFEPHARVEAHKHACDYCEIILEGSQQVTRRWHHAGDIRIAKANTAYGPLIAGPEGCTVLVIFSEGDKWPALTLAKPGQESVPDREAQHLLDAYAAADAS